MLWPKLNGGESDGEGNKETLGDFVHLLIPEDRRPVLYKGAEAHNLVCDWAAVHKEGTGHRGMFVDLERNEK